ncbi:MAG: response regulator [Caldilinea sp.]
MTSQSRILVMDDEEKWRHELSNTLRRNGYSVDAVATKAAALDLLQRELYHLLILDIRMVDPDESNVEGMDLLAELARLNLLEAIEIVMLSAYGTKEQMREAFKRYSVADFQAKEHFSGRDFVGSVNQIFTERVRWNGALDIIWEEIDTPTQAVVGIAVDGKRVKRGTVQQEQVFFELEELLRRLFHRASSILVAPLIPGRSGAGVLRVQPFFAAGKGEAVVVKFGYAPMIELERHNFKLVAGASA